jgi:peptidoglycan L-alanyl-D-glutamate endopeptidase CwlK
MNEFHYGEASKRKLLLAHPELRAVAGKALSYGVVDITIVWTFRDEDTQNAIADQTPVVSTKRWPDSMHNALDEDGKPCSNALDFAPYINGRIPWGDQKAFVLVGGLMLAAASELEIEIVYGGDWDRDGLIEEHSLGDYGHIQRVIG